MTKLKGLDLVGKFPSDNKYEDGFDNLNERAAGFYQDLQFMEAVRLFSDEDTLGLENEKTNYDFRNHPEFQYRFFYHGESERVRYDIDRIAYKIFKNLIDDIVRLNQVLVDVIVSDASIDRPEACELEVLDVVKFGDELEKLSLFLGGFLEHVLFIYLCSSDFPNNIFDEKMKVREDVYRVLEEKMSDWNDNMSYFDKRVIAPNVDWGSLSRGEFVDKEVVAISGSPIVDDLYKCNSYFQNDIEQFYEKGQLISVLANYDRQRVLLENYMEVLFMEMNEVKFIDALSPLVWIQVFLYITKHASDMRASSISIKKILS